MIAKPRKRHTETVQNIVQNTAGSKSAAKPCVYKGTAYPSIKAAIEIVYGENSSPNKNRIRKALE